MGRRLVNVVGIKSKVMTCPRMSDFLSHSGFSFPVEVDDAEADAAEGGLLRLAPAECSRL